MSAYCKSRPNCVLMGERCLTCEYGNLVTVSFKEYLALLAKITKAIEALDRCDSDNCIYVRAAKEALK